MDVSPEGVSELERANQSKCGLTHFIKSLKHATLEKLRSRRESNPHLRFRKPLFYPLNYGDNDIYDCRFSICDFKAKTVHSRLSMSVTISVPDRDGRLCQLDSSWHPGCLR